MIVSIVTLGCRTNECESRQMAEQLASLGFDVSLNLIKADYYILNTCSITQAADAKSRQLISRVLKKNANAKIYICGCSSEYNKDFFINLKNVEKVFGTKDKFEIIKCFSKINEQKKANLTIRKLVKIQDGCNQFCSYCIVPYLRNTLSSKNINTVISEINNSVENEINITGINLFLFKDGLTNLLNSLQNTDKRIRLGSLDPRVIDDAFLLACRNIKNFCPQFHLSVQSLCDKTLINMHRQYKADFVLERVNLIRKYFKNAFVACDIIVGFPCESDDDFSTSFENAKKANFAYMHVFPFSLRKGTMAEKMKQVDSKIKTDRANVMQKLNEENFNAYKNIQINKTEEILIEEFKNGFYVGHTKNYIKCFLDENAKIGDIIDIQFLQNKNDGMLVKSVDK